MDGEGALVGLTADDLANSVEITRVELSQVGKPVKAGDEVAAVVFSNTKRPVCAPLSGTVIEINRNLESHPDLVKEDPYGSGWLFRLEIEAGEEIEHLLASTAYREQLRAAEALDIEVP